MSGPLTRKDGHVLVTVRLTPNGGRDAIDGVATAGDGQSHLKARVCAIAEGGKANRALTELFARDLGLSRSSVTVVSGQTSRMKILRIEGDPEEIEQRLGLA